MCFGNIKSYLANYLVLGGVLLLAGVVLALRQLRVHGVEKLLVGGVAHVEARLVHHGHDAPVRFVDQVADVLKDSVRPRYLAMRIRIQVVIF